jgi:hypothetical protein
VCLIGMKSCDRYLSYKVFNNFKNFFTTIARTLKVLVNESLIFVNEAWNSINESLIFVNEAWNSINESLIFVNEAWSLKFRVSTSQFMGERRVIPFHEKSHINTDPVEARYIASLQNLCVS